MNSRFAEYATSGAFALGLTRSQVASLSQILGTGDALIGQASALERKGLVERVRRASEPFTGDNYEYRLTGAGALVMALCRMAGLTNAGDDAAAVEIAALHADLDEARTRASDAASRCRSMHARLQESEREAEELRRELAGLRSGVRLRNAAEWRGARPIITLRDPLPEMSTDQLLEGLPE